MGKPRAQIQKEYRERKKRQEEESFLKKKERKGVKKYYVKTSNLTTKERKERRKSRRERLKKFRKIRQKTIEPKEINETMIVAMYFSSFQVKVKN